VSRTQRQRSHEGVEHYVDPHLFGVGLLWLLQVLHVLLEQSGLHRPVPTRHEADLFVSHCPKIAIGHASNGRSGPGPLRPYFWRITEEKAESRGIRPEGGLHLFDRKISDSVANEAGDAVSGLLLMTPPAAAQALSISERTLWELTRVGRIPCIRLGRLVRYDVSALRAWLSRESERPGDGMENGIDHASAKRPPDDSIRRE
jgi:excisionase family DNA binding protein